MSLHNKKTGKIIRYSSMMFILIFNAWLLRNMQDALLITAPYSGVETIVLLQALFMLPAAFFAKSLYGLFIKNIDKYKAFYSFIIVYLLDLYFHFFAESSSGQ